MSRVEDLQREIAEDSAKASSQEDKAFGLFGLMVCVNSLITFFGGLTLVTVFVDLRWGANAPAAVFWTLAFLWAFAASIFAGLMTASILLTKNYFLRNKISVKRNEVEKLIKAVEELAVRKANQEKVAELVRAAEKDKVSEFYQGPKSPQSAQERVPGATERSGSTTGTNKGRSPRRDA